MKIKEFELKENLIETSYNDIDIKNTKNKSISVDKLLLNQEVSINQIKEIRQVIEELKEFRYLPETYEIISSVFKEKDNEIQDLSIRYENLSIQIQQLMDMRKVLEILLKNFSQGANESIPEESLSIPEKFKDNIVEVNKAFECAEGKKKKGIIFELELLKKMIEKKTKAKRVERLMAQALHAKLNSEEKKIQSSNDISCCIRDKIPSCAPDIIHARFSEGWSLKDHTQYLKYISKYHPDYEKNNSIILACIEKNPNELEYVSRSHPLYIKFAMRAIREDEEVLLSIIPDFLDDVELMNEAILKNIFVYLNEKIKPLLPEETQQDKTIEKYVNKMKLINKKYAMMGLKGDTDVLKKYNMQDYDFANLSSVCKEDKEIGILAVKRNPLYIQYLSNTLRGDAEIMKLAIEQNRESIKFIPGEMQNNPKVFGVIKELIKINPSKFEDFSKEIQTNKEIIKLIFPKYPNFIRYLYHENLMGEIENDEEICKISLRYSPRSIEFFSEKLRGNLELVKEAIMKDKSCIQFVSNELKNSVSFGEFILESRLDLIDELSEDLQNKLSKSKSLN